MCVDVNNSSTATITEFLKEFGSSGRDNLLIDQAKVSGVISDVNSFMKSIVSGCKGTRISLL